MGCCLFAMMVAGMPRLAFLVWWLLQPVRFQTTFNSWFWALLGVIFLPWTALMYVIVFPGGITWFDWIWLGLALFIDIGTYAGGARSRSSS